MTMTYEKIVTLFDTAQHADAARQNLEASGFSPSDISIISSKTSSVAGNKLNEPGLWHKLFGRDVQMHEAIVYGRTVESGGAVLTVRVPETDVARATSILNAHQAVDVQQRAASQRLLTKETPKTAPATMAAGRTAPG